MVPAGDELYRGGDQYPVCP